MSKPTSVPDWIPDNDPAKISTPSASKQATGWLSGEKPPFQYFNWFWNAISKWIQWFDARTPQWNIIIDTTENGGDYETLVAYLADSPASGDRVFINTDQTITAKLTIPAGIKLGIQKGKKISCASNLTTVIEFGNTCETEGEFVIELSHIASISEAVSFNGDNNHHENIVVKNTGAGLVTTAFIIKSGKKSNTANGEVINSGIGTIISTLIDSSGRLSNQVNIRDDDSNIIYRAADLPVASGGTGASNSADALSNLGLTATAGEINAVCDDGKYNSKGMLLGDATAGRVLRVCRLYISDGTNPDTIKVKLESIFNGDSLDWIDNIGAGYDGTYWQVLGNVSELVLKSTGITGTVVEAFGGNLVYNVSTSTTVQTSSISVHRKTSSDISIHFTDTNFTEVNLATELDNEIAVDFIYITDQ